MTQSFGKRAELRRGGLWRRTAAVALLSAFGAISIVQAQVHGHDVWQSIGLPTQSGSSGTSGGGGTIHSQQAVPISTFSGFTSATETGSSAFTAFSGVKYGITLGQLQVTFPTVTAGKAALLVMNNVNNVNFSTAGGACMTLTNPQSTALTLDIWAVDTNNNSWRFTVTMPPNSTAKYAMPFANLPDPSTVGMAALPNVYQGYQTVMGRGSTAVNWSNIASIQVYSLGPNAAATVNIGTISLLPPVSLANVLAGAVNRWGLSAITTNENPIGADSDLAQRNAQEQTALAGPSALTNVDMYGGSTSLPKQTASGHWQLKQVNGKWWFVDPLGSLYFMSGVDQIDPSANAAVVTGKSGMFASLPAMTDPLAANYGSAVMNGQSVQTYNFYTQNLQLKYGTANWRQPWLDTTAKRLKNWGFNSYGSYSEWNVANSGTLPYLANLSMTGITSTIATGNNTAAALLPDPYDPSFPTVLAQNLATSLQTMGNDSMLVGVYTGIELGWTGPDGPNANYGLAFGVMNTPVNQASHVALTKFLSNRYRFRITRLNAYWHTTFKSFNDVKFPLGYTGNLSTFAQRDLAMFESIFAAKFFSTARAVVKAADPNLLYMGTEIGHYLPEMMNGAVGNVDAICVNHYDTTLPSDVIADAKAYNLPVLITEFDFGSTESGMWSGGLAAQASEADRDAAAVSYLNQALAANNVVGANWYQYVDQPLTGGSWGAPRPENYNEGLVDQTDTPYAPLIAAMKQFHSNMYSTRWNN